MATKRIKFSQPMAGINENGIPFSVTPGDEKDWEEKDADSIIKAGYASEVPQEKPAAKAK